MVFYRKYRPQKIEDLDSSEVREKLYSVLGGIADSADPRLSRDARKRTPSPASLDQSVPHAFLFTGPKGLGKTSTARIVAKVVNCEQRNVILSEAKDLKSKRDSSSAFGETQNDSGNIAEPCNECHQCVSITNGTNIDVLEIDGASNRGIDEIRDLREKIKLSPASSKKKVYIIDEVHMLTTEAFNALLKTLEEPPSHVLFILCTTEPHKVPVTIASRCFHIQFNKATLEELVSSFERIIKSEKLKGDKEALGLIASLSDGSFRDGSKILEEMVLVASGNKLTKELIEQKYKISNIEYQISQMLEILVNKDVKRGLDQVSKLSDQGVEMGYFIERLIQALHSYFLYKAGVENSSKLKLKSLELGIEETKRLIEILAKAHSELKYAVLPQLPLEMAIAEWGLTRSGSPRPLNGVARGPALPAEALAKAGPAARSSKGAPSSLTSSNEDARLWTPPLASPAKSATPRSSRADPLPRAAQVDNLLQEIINKVKSYNHSVAGVLRGCKVISYDKDKLVIEAGFKFHKERLSEKKTMEIIEKACEDILGKPVVVSVVLKTK